MGGQRGGPPHPEVRPPHHVYLTCFPRTQETQQYLLEASPPPYVSLLVLPHWLLPVPPRTFAAHVLAQFTARLLGEELSSPSPPALSRTLCGAFVFVCRQIYNTCEGLGVLQPYGLHRAIAAAWRKVRGPPHRGWSRSCLSSVGQTSLGLDGPPAQTDELYRSTRANVTVQCVSLPDHCIRNQHCERRLAPLRGNLGWRNSAFNHKEVSFLNGFIDRLT